jgi:hypothetical protein
LRALILQGTSMKGLMCKSILSKGEGPESDTPSGMSFLYNQLRRSEARHSFFAKMFGESSFLYRNGLTIMLVGDFGPAVLTKTK